MKRKPAVAGLFYPYNKESLERALENIFKNIERKDYLLVISPHAGYQYSGRTAAFAINSLKPSKTFILLGPNHNVMGEEFSIMSSGVWETPLGEIKIDENLANELKECGVLKEDHLAHLQEHSIEVQLPFLQHRFGDFKFVPISITNIDYSKEFLNKCEKLGKHIAKVIKNKDIRLIASSDFSHYLQSKVADEKDKKAIEKIKNLDPNGFFKVLEETDASICGYGPIAVLMYVAKNLGLKKVEIINHTNSGDVTGDYSSVVSYYAIGFK
ncbi:MAG: AmmeMemoRadiSam system protein B [Candidatus Aenigmatarchaeota archaeon]